MRASQWTMDGTRWPRLTATDKGEQWRPEWEDLLDWFAHPATLPDGDGPEPEDPKARKEWQRARKAQLHGWSPCTFHGPRRISAFMAATALALDADSELGAEGPKRGEPDLDPERLHTAIGEALPDNAWAAHTSPSSRPNAWRWRVVVPLSRAVDKHERDILVSWIRLRCARTAFPAMIEADPQPNKDCSRFWFAPAEDPMAPEGSYQWCHLDGEVLDADQVLSQVKKSGEAVTDAAQRLDADCDAMVKELWPTDPAGDMQREYNEIARKIEEAERARQTLTEARAEVVRRAEAMGVKLDTGGTGDSPAQFSVADLVGDALAAMRRRAAGEDLPVPFPPVWSETAETVGGGFWPGLHVLVGGTGTGKSQWALQLALHAAQQGTPVLYVGLELGKVDLIARALAMLAPTVDGSGFRYTPQWSDLYLGRENATEVLDRMCRAKVEQRLAELPLRFEFGGPMGWPAGRLGAAVTDLCTAHPPGPGRPPLVVLDYLQVVGSPAGDTIDLRERIARASYQGRAVAREQDAAVLLVSSTARDNYATLGGVSEPWRQPPGAVVGLGKESGEIEYAADSVLALAAEPWRDIDPAGKRRMPPGGTRIHLAVAKVRAGVGQWIDLRFDGASFHEPTEMDVRRAAPPVGWVKMPIGARGAIHPVTLTFTPPDKDDEDKPCSLALCWESPDGGIKVEALQGKRAQKALQGAAEMDYRPCLDGGAPVKRTTDGDGDGGDGGKGGDDGGSGDGNGGKGGKGGKKAQQLEEHMDAMFRGAP